MAGLINTAVSGLKLSELALSIAGQNIVNANTAGYSRQSVTAETASTLFAGVGYIGTGVTVSSIERNTAQYLVDQVTKDLSVLGEFEKYLSNISQMDSLLADPSSSVAASMDNFFEALNGVANNPSGIESRQLLLTQTHLMLNRFQSAETTMLNQNQSLNSQLGTYASNITTIGKEIAELNSAITASEGLASGALPNDLLDRRDILVNDLAKIVDVSTTIDNHMSMSVFIGEGQGLVIGPQSSELVSVDGVFDPSRAELAFLVNNQPQVVTGQLTGGEIGGVLRFRNEALNPALNALGRIALAITDAMNRQQELGVDLEGNLGNPIFTDINNSTLTNNRVRNDFRNALPADRQITVTIDDVSQLTTSDYKVVFPGPGQRYSIIKLEDNSLVSQGILNSKLPHEVEIDGFTINFEAGSFQEGDSYLIQPTRAGISGLDVLATRPEDFALASPITTETGIGNQGGAFVASTLVRDVSTSQFTTSPGQLSPPVLIRFTTPTTYDVLDYSDPANPVSLLPPLNNRIFVPGTLNSVFPDDPDGTSISSSPASSGITRLSQLTNGYSEEIITVTRIDPVTGFSTESDIEIDTNVGANTLAQRLTSIEGVSATASSQMQLFGFTSDDSDIPLNIILNGIDLTGPALTENRVIPDPLDADFLRDSINASQLLQNMGITAISDGEALTVRSSTGVDLVVEVTGNGGDSLKIRDGDLRSIVGRNDLSTGYTSAVNSSFDLDLGFGPTTVSLSPGTISYNQVETVLQADINRALGAGVVRVTRTDLGTIQLEPIDKSRVLTVDNVLGQDVLGIEPLTIYGPDIGDQAAVLSGGISSTDPFDFSVLNGTFNLTVNGIYTDAITLNQNYPANSGAAILAAINGQILASTGASGLAGQVIATLDAAGSIQFVTTDLGPSANVIVSAAVGTQGLIANGVASGVQLSGTQASITGAVDVNGGADFTSGGPHTFNLAVDGNPPVAVSLTGRTGIPATFTNTLDISAGVDLTAVPNTFDLTVAGFPLAVIDISGVDTTLAANPMSSAPQGIANLIQQQIDGQLGAGVVTVGVNVFNQLTLQTVDAGLSTSITVSNPTGDVATSVFPVVGTSVGSELGGAGVVNIVRSAINASLAAVGQDPVDVGIDSDGFLTVSSTTYGANSQISISDVVGGLGMIFPGTDHGERFSNSATVGGTIDLQLAANTTLASDQVDGMFGSEPVAISNYTGYQVTLNSGQGGNGVPVAGDTFLIDFNVDGSTDNTNALAMMSLSNEHLLSNGNLGLLTAYGQVVEEIGILTNQSRISHEASESLLRQSEAALQSIAGVNIDEEAANLIKFEQHYNASAQLISIARDMFNAILDL